MCMDLFQDLRLDDLTENQRAIAEYIGIEAYVKLSFLCGGTRPYITKRDEIIKDARDRRIKKEYNGCNIDVLAMKYDLTDVRIRQILFSNDIKKGQLKLPLQ